MPKGCRAAASFSWFFLSPKTPQRASALGLPSVRSKRHTCCVLLAIGRAIPVGSSAPGIYETFVAAQLFLAQRRCWLSRRHSSSPRGSNSTNGANTPRGLPHRLACATRMKANASLALLRLSSRNSKARQPVIGATPHQTGQATQTIVESWGK